MARRVGLPLHVTAADQLQHARHPTAGGQRLPDGAGGRGHAADVGVVDASPLTFLVVGDHGGVLDQTIAGSYAAVTKDGQVPPGIDRFTIPS